MRVLAYIQERFERPSSKARSEAGKVSSAYSLVPARVSPSRFPLVSFSRSLLCTLELGRDGTTIMQKNPSEQDSYIVYYNLMCFCSSVFCKFISQICFTLFDNFFEKRASTAMVLMRILVSKFLERQLTRITLERDGGLISLIKTYVRQRSS